MAFEWEQLKLRRLILIGACLTLTYLALVALFPETVITIVRVGKQTYHLNWRF